MFKDKFKSASKTLVNINEKCQDWILLAVIGFSLADHIAYYVGGYVDKGYLLYGYILVAFAAFVDAATRLTKRYSHKVLNLE